METKFKSGDRICYKTHPDICIGYISSDIQLGDCGLIFDGVEKHYVPIHVSGAWAKHFGHGVCPNSMRVDEDEIMLFTEEAKTDLPLINIDPNRQTIELNKFYNALEPTTEQTQWNSAELNSIINAAENESLSIYEGLSEDHERAAIRYFSSLLKRKLNLF